MKLYGIHLSPFYERAYIVLDAKGVTDKVETSMVPGGLGSDAHVAANPLAKIPYLVMDDGRVLTEGQTIAEYFNEIFTEGPSLLSDDPFEAARARQLTRIVDMDLSMAIRPFAQAVIFQNRNDDDIKRSIESSVPRALDAVEHFIDADSYAVGGAFSLADAALISAVFQLEVLGGPFGLQGLGDRPKLQAWKALMDKEPLAVASWARMQAVLDKLAARQKAS